jgi:hypothetical protein
MAATTISLEKGMRVEAIKLTRKTPGYPKARANSESSFINYLKRNTLAKT